MQSVTPKWIYTQKYSAEERKTKLCQCHHLIKITNLQALGRTSLKTVTFGFPFCLFCFLWSLSCSRKCKANRRGVLERTMGLLHDALQTWERLRLAKYVASDGGQKPMPVEGGVRKEQAFYGISLGSKSPLAASCGSGLPTECVTFSVFPYG